jgi:type VI secretion system protein ImpG
VAVIRLRLRCLGDVTLPMLGLDRLRFYLAGESPLMHALYELLGNNVQQIVLATGEGSNARQLTLPPASLQPVGFDPDESMLNYDNRSFLGYRLLHEYFAFPEKFLFVELQHLSEAGRAGFERDLEIAIYLSEFQRPERLARLVQTVNVETFRLGCTPVINLFTQPAEPIRLTHQKAEYLVIPDIRQPWGMEVYSIDSVRNVVSYRDQEEIVGFQPFYSLKHHYLQEPSQTAFWYATRWPTEYKDSSGTDVYISLVDLAFNPTVPKVETLSLSLTCTNRDLPGQLPFGGGSNDFEVEGGSAVSRIRCLTKPTPTQRPPLRRGSQWRLISHLALNYLSLTEDGREALLEILSLYNFTDAAVIKKQIAGITKVSSRPCIRRVRQLQRVAFVRGTEIALEFDEDQYIGSGIYLFASVLEHFFGHYCALNSFTQLTVTSQQREKTVALWPPRLGAAILV